jgi:hypothetical protein
MPLVYRIRQVPLHNNNKIIIAVTIMQKENPGINKYLVVATCLLLLPIQCSPLVEYYRTIGHTVCDNKGAKICTGAS